jgi:hypothetical protein
MHKLLGMMAILVTCASVAGAQMMPRRWVIIDARGAGAAGLAFLSNAEGFERARAAQAGQPMTTFQVGGNFTNFLANVGNGDELVIIAHSAIERVGPMDRTIRRFAMIWSGMPFFGFGPGMGEMPVPAGLANLMNVRVTMHTCFSARDPDGNGAETALTDKLRARMGAGCTVAGYMNSCVSNNVWNVTGGTLPQRNAARTVLQDNRTLWNLLPPANRPGAARTQASVGDSIAKASNAALTLDLPSQIGVSPNTRGYVMPREGTPPPPKPGLDDLIDPRLAVDEFEVDTCLGDCEEGCGIASTISQGEELVPVEVEVLGIEAEPTRVRVVWRVRDAASSIVTVHRRVGDAPYAAHRTGTIERGVFDFEDRDVVPGSRLGYVLELRDESGARFAGEVEVEVPSSLALRVAAAGFHPVRSSRLRVSFVLPADAPATLLLHDVRGRAVAQRDVGGAGIGAHTLEWEVGDLPAGLYGLRLVQAGRVVLVKVTVL